MDWPKWTSVFLSFQQIGNLCNASEEMVFSIPHPSTHSVKDGDQPKLPAEKPEFGQINPIQRLGSDILSSVYSLIPRVLPSVPPPPNAGLKESSKGLRRNLLKGSVAAELHQATWGRVTEPDFFTPPGRGICLADTWEIYSLSSPSCWIKFLNPSPVGRFA